MFGLFQDHILRLVYHGETSQFLYTPLTNGSHVDARRCSLPMGTISFILYSSLVTSSTLLYTVTSISVLRSQEYLICALPAPVSSGIALKTTATTGLIRNLLDSIAIEALTPLTHRLTVLSFWNCGLKTISTLVILGHVNNIGSLPRVLNSL
jgi:hypothetical protein